ncbi:MAG: MG2 domain-containing protein [Planctomycetota bacterium]|nr:MG2 domain-containing protein [Planctomycetota bacterium]
MRMLSLLLVFCCTLPAAAGPREEQWKKVQEAMDKGLPKTAIESLNPIIAGAIKDQAYAEAVKAMARKIALEGNLEGNKPAEKITRLQAEIAKAPTEIVPVLDVILANWYWHYFQQNRGRFLQRTATAAAPGNDFATWDLPRLFAEIDKQFTKGLSAADKLKATPVSAFDDLLEQGTLPDTYRPTMFDFLAHNGLAFYASGEQAAIKAQGAFDLLADGPIFAPVAEFLAWKIAAVDNTEPVVRTLHLYQQLLVFHEKDTDPAALLDADLARLRFGYNKAFGEEKKTRYKAALKRFVDKWGDHEISAMASFHWASVLHEEHEFAEARQVAQRAANAFANSVGGKLCYNLISQIEAKSSTVITERVWNQPLPTIQVRYRNVTQVHFRVVPFSYEERLKTRPYRPEQLDQPERDALLAKPPVKAWAVDLPATADFQERVEEVAAPQDLKFGSYFLIASHDPNFTDANNIVTFADFWVSDLALVIRSKHGKTVVEGFVLNAITGAPLANAEVRVWYYARNNTRTAGPTAKTNENGLFSLSTDNQMNYLLHVRHGDQELASARDFHSYRGDFTVRPSRRTIFFTDRALYRPGQTVQYKGLCIDVNPDNDNYKTLAGQTLTVIFADPNHKEIARQQQQTNDYGSFSGSFTAPRDRLLGRMLIRVDGEPPGQALFNVEEYKRPKFQVTLEKPKTAAKLNVEVGLQGKALGYTGAAINDAKVRYRVVREVRYPVWWGWYFWWRMPQSNSQEITHGSTVTKSDGSFNITFTAKPDLSVAATDEPVFHYAVHADVTDTTGETRSTHQDVSVGYTALQATLSVADWQAVDQPVQITVKTATLDGEGQLAEGALKIYRLKQPEKVQRPKLAGHQPYPVSRGGKGQASKPQPPADASNPNSWPLGEVVQERGFTTDAAGNASFSFPLEAGVYRAVLDTQDRFGKKVTAQVPIQVLDPTAKTLSIKIPDLVAAPAWTVEPGTPFTAVWGSGYEQARAFVEIEHRNKLVQSFWTEAGRTQVAIRQAVTEAMRGGFTLRLTMVRENRAHLESRHVDVPWSNKNLTVKWEHFVSKLAPAQQETWSAIVTGPDAKQAVAEMVATLYDASLDAYLPHHWPGSFGVFRQDYSRLQSQFENQLQHFQHLRGQWRVAQKDASFRYRAFPADIIVNVWGYGALGRNRADGMKGGMEGGGPGARRGAMMLDVAPAAPMAAMQKAAAGEQMEGLAQNRMSATVDFAKRDGAADKSGAGTGPAPEPDLSKVSARKNLNETAFFFPQLLADAEGVVKLQFTLPEALTEWKFLGFAHDRDLRSGLLQDKAVTAKDLMVQPNPPRFLREGDRLEFTVKVSNQSPTRQTGTVRLTLADARTAKPVDAALGNTELDVKFDVPTQESRSFAWKLNVPDGMSFLTYKTVGSTGRLSDGEEGFLPVLSRRILVTESLPLPIRGPQTKQFNFTKLRESGKSDTLRNQSLTVQIVSNPSWYAVMALPYLMEFPHECTEQTFNRLYANALARHISKSDAKIHRVFEQWRGTPALDSPLEKNQDLKAVLLEETPWLRQAQAESQARRNVGVLFDDNRLNEETSRLLRKLAEQQLPDGAWPWFPGGPGNDYITLYITTGFGRLRHLGVDLDVASAVKSLNRLDGWIDGVYREILKHSDKDKNHLSSTIALYLYGRSFFLKDKPIADPHKAAVDYFLGQAKEYWLELACRQSQAHLAVALKRFGEAEAAQAIMRSIKERSVSNEELGMFWRDLERSWWWYHAPIETQAMMIEAFDEVMNDAQAVEDCKVWLLKQKQTQDWKTTKATADAVYALLLRGANLLASDELVQVSLAGTPIKPEKVEAGTGFYEQRFVGPEITPELGQITVKKVDQGVAWGSIHWQYLEDLTKVTAYEGTPLKLVKQLYTKESTDKGPVLKAVVGPVKVGDELVVRIDLRTDRDMEYVHLKDYRGSGTEPVNVLSRYKYQDGLGYYETTRDTASHFFIDYLPKGTYVFEYSTRVVHKGQYQTGMAQIQCMYAPEFNSHSESFTLVVQ